MRQDIVYPAMWCRLMPSNYSKSKDDIGIRYTYGKY